MDEKMGSFIVMLIQTVVFLTPVLILFYRQGRRDQVLDEAVRDINGLGAKVSEIKDHQSQSLAELKGQIEIMNNTLVRVSTWMDFIKQSVEELKAKT
jgi:hypothetical protein